MKLALSLFLALSLVGASAFAGEKLTHKVAKISIDVPRGWKTAKGDVLAIADPDEEIAVTFIVVDTGAVRKAAKIAGRELAKMVKKLKIGKEAKVTINGMAGVKVEGTGRIDGKPVDLMIIVLDTPSDDKDLMILAIGETAKIAKHKRAIRHVFDHIKPLE